MLGKANVLKVVFCAIALTLLAFSRLSYADWSIGIGVGDRDHHDGGWDHHQDDRWNHHERRDDHFFYRWHDRPHYGWHIHFLPEGYHPIWVGGVRYFYYDGLYYTYIGDGDYVLVNPPFGAVVADIPPDFQPVVINGRTYYANNGYYYILTPRGYRLVRPPEVYNQPEVIVTQPAPAAPQYAQDSFPINVPNNNGSYTTVVIRKSGNGYVGPQGEFYATFPTVAQLKAMYTK